MAVLSLIVGLRSARSVGAFQSEFAHGRAVGRQLVGGDRRRRRKFAALSGPNLIAQQRTVSRLTSIPRWARSSSTSRMLSVSLKYSHTSLLDHFGRKPMTLDRDRLHENLHLSA